jgi:hypothetical protein
MDTADSKTISSLLSELVSIVSEFVSENNVHMEQALSERGVACTVKVNPQEYSEHKNIAPQYRIIENFVIIWLEPNMDVFNNDYKKSITDLQAISNSIKVFDNGKECSDFLHNLTDYKVCLILSDALGAMYISLIHDVPQLDSIYE